MRKMHLTTDRRPLHQVTDPATRELRYREMFYEANLRQRQAEKSLARAFLLLRQVLNDEPGAREEADEWLERLTGQ